MLSLAKLAQQQKNQRATKNAKKVWKQIHDQKIAELFETKTKKLEEVDKSTKR